MSKKIEKEFRAELKIPKGEWESSPMKGTENHCLVAQVFDSNGKSLVTVDSRYGEQESTDISILIADAGNTYNKTGKTPSEHAEENEKLIELKEAYKECFEKFIPLDKWDEATMFLSTHGSGLATEFAKKDNTPNHLKP